MTSDGETRSYDAVLVSNGHHWDPKLPDFPGTFDGHARHSHSYETPAGLEGRRVLVIGIDGVRVDMLARAVTPTLDSLAEAGFPVLGVEIDRLTLLADIVGELPETDPERDTGVDGRIQLVDLRQTHVLPEDAAARERRWVRGWWVDELAPSPSGDGPETKCSATALPSRQLTGRWCRYCSEPEMP